MKSVGDIQALLPEHITLDPKTILELIKEFSSTWVSLDAYDTETLKLVGKTRKAIKLSGVELINEIQTLRSELLKKVRQQKFLLKKEIVAMLKGLWGTSCNLSVARISILLSKKKRRILLYFMVKNHPFVDGNKRSGAWAFLWFLRKARLKSMRSINPNALTALTLLIAESKPEKKEQMVRL